MLSSLQEINHKTLSAAQKIAALHSEAAKASWEQHSQHVQALWSAKTPQELMALQSSALQPLAEKASAYSRDLLNITSGWGQEWRTLSQNHTANTQGSNTMLSAFQDAVSSISEAIQSMQKVVQQSTHLAQANIAVATEDAMIKSR